MGMGLSITYTIIANHGGEMTVETQEGDYTDFQFDLLKHTAIENTEHAVLEDEEN